MLTRSSGIDFSRQLRAFLMGVLRVMMHLLRDDLEAKRDQFLNELAHLSMLDCGTHNKSGVDHVGQYMQAKLVTLGARVETVSHNILGDTVIGRWHGTGTARLLLIGHLDTVYPDGWVEAHPFQIEGDRVRGPGTADMKAGLLAGCYAVEALHSVGFSNYAEITFLLNSDEEIGSPSSKGLIEREAQERDAVLVLECGRENGDIVSARKGIVHYELAVQGRAAHAGVEPERGRHAILELAHQIIAFQALNGYAPGVTVNVGVIGGGTKSNVVPAEARAEVDVRAADRAGLEGVIAALQRSVRQLTVPGTMAILTSTTTRPPMEKTAGTARLVRMCQAVANSLGFTINDAATGGTSDANFTSAIGVPTLDGLGPVGGLDHSPSEYILLSSIVPRTALLAGLIHAIARGGGNSDGE